MGNPCLRSNFFCCIFGCIMASVKNFSFTLLQVDAALIATGRAPFTQGLGLENVGLSNTYVVEILSC
jgi:pyruvate/2-oxoglutarate dehydrogenase complex dihydrolipoamide dehydrogenase (E3) component